MLEDELDWSELIIENLSVISNCSRGRNLSSINITRGYLIYKCFIVDNISLAAADLLEIDKMALSKEEWLKKILG